MTETGIDGAFGQKLCEQCKEVKELSAFHRRKNKTDNRMRICAQCYMENLHETQRREAEAMQKRREQQELERQERERRIEQAEQERLARQQVLDAWYLQQPASRCVDCKQVLAASAFDYSMMREIDGTWIPATLHKRCKPCHEAYRERNRQINPLCPMCGSPTRVFDFLREYQGHRLDIIKVCCENCIPRFEALTEPEQLELLRRAMVKAYGETAVIYALQYDDSFPCQHIGRTKHYTRRMAEYKRKDWYKDIQSHFILQQLPFGPLSMEYESRWMMHALKYRWPIDNFDLLKGGEDGLSGQHTQARLIEAVQSFEPLTAPFEVVGPLLRENFMNTCDAKIVNWYCSRHERRAAHSEKEMVQRVALMERLHGLKIAPAERALNG